MMDLIRGDLKPPSASSQDVFSSERALVEAGKVVEVRAGDPVEQRDLVYTGVLEPPKGKKSEDWEAAPADFCSVRHGVR